MRDALRPLPENTMMWCIERAGVRPGGNPDRLIALTSRGRFEALTSCK